MNKAVILLRDIGIRLWEDIRRNRLPLALLLLYGVATQMLFQTVCPWAILTHLPCPACGLTRAGLCVCTLHLREALRLNATICLWGPYLIYAFVLRYVLQRDKGRLLAPAACIAGITIVYFVYRVLHGMLPTDLVPAAPLLSAVDLVQRHFTACGIYDKMYSKLR